MNQLEINSAFINDLLVFLNTKVNNYEKTEWVLYGSVVTNTMNKKSDIDIFLLNDKIKTPERISETFKSFPLTIYKLNKDDIVDDGKKKKYGGFFIGKLLCPYLIISYNENNLRNLIRKSVGEFISSFAQTHSKGKREFNSENLMAICFKSYLDIFPHYDAYLLKLFITTNFKNIWNHVTSEICIALVLSNSIEKKGIDKFSFCKSESFNYEKEKTKVVTRFWLFASKLHGSDIEFPDIYFSKSELFTTGRQRDVRRLIKFLNKKQLQK